ncbi:MAG: discoidin domain-containing protein, partial [Planctomycetota bacterium]|nr:discoidin domain-containing protein [Planctomycetota bacterium]
VQALRLGSWKALRPVGKPMQLYNLGQDLGETRDVAAANGAVVERIADLMNECRTPSEHFPLGAAEQSWLGKDWWANRLQDWRRRGTRIECISERRFRTAHLLTQRIEGAFTLSLNLGTAGEGGVGGVLFGPQNPLVHGVTGPGAGIFAGVGPDGQIVIRDLAKETLTVAARAFLPRKGWKILAVDSEETGQEGALAIDGDPATKWHSQWRQKKPAHPHFLAVDLGKSQAFDGCAVLPRQVGRNGNIQRYTCEVSDDAKRWRVVAKGTFTNDATLKRVGFESTVTARYVRLTSQSAHNKRPVASIAEFYLFKGEVPNPPRDATLEITYRNGTLAVNGKKRKVGPIAGNLALVSHRGSFWFDGLKLDGAKADPDRAVGPILSAQYTVSRGALHITAQLMPVAGGEVFLDTAGKTHRARVGRGYTATLRVAPWNAAKAQAYRLRYRDSEWSGVIRADPVDKPELVLAALSCNHNNSHRIGRQPFDWRTGVWFPHRDLTALVAQHHPDLLFFAGDQLYEGRSPSPADRDHLESDYLYKWYLWCWAYRELTRDTPCVVIPDDHDVFQGNLWGAGGRRTDRDSKGGYVHPASFVRLVERTQTSHLPDPFDPRPVARGIGVYFTELVWGDVSFAILEDRKFKSGCMGPLPPTGTNRPDHINDPDFDMAKADVSGLTLLGERQLAFLESWRALALDRPLRAVLSQTAFAGLATHHGAGQTYLRADLDSNGWPQSGRNRALRLIAAARAVHICGDQHLATVVRHGIDEHDDGPWGFCVPAAANFYPRKWWPQGAKSPFGKHRDGFGNRVTVHAVANPVKTGKGELHDGMPGFGIVRFDKRNKKIVFECWPRHGGPQYPGWPVAVDAR